MQSEQTNLPELDRQIELGSDVMVKFGRFNVQTMAKVDTGATMSSINAQDMFFNKETNQITFKSPAITDKHRSLTMDVADKVEISSADGGTTTRYVIKLDVEIAGVKLQSQQFNLSDREHMDYDILIGQDILKAGNFVVNVNQPEESLDEQYTIEHFVASIVQETLTWEDAINAVTNKRVDFTLNEVVKFIQKQTLYEIYGTQND